MDKKKNFDPSTIPGVHIRDIRPVIIKDVDGTERKVWRGMLSAADLAPKGADDAQPAPPSLRED